MRNYSFIGHTADVRLLLEASTLQELFQAALEGMAFLIQPVQPTQQEPEQVLEVTLQAQDTTTLLIDFLSEVLTLSHIYCSVFLRAECIELTPTHIRAKIFGMKVNHFDKDVKAVTYHETNVIKNQNGNFETVVVFDI